jgi:transcription initiation factor IIF auxiliary subunit
LKEHLEKEVELMHRKREDYFFALQILDHNHVELSSAYEAAIFEIDKLKNELEALKSCSNFKRGLDELVD